jgi:hypothetical protein
VRNRVRIGSLWLAAAVVSPAALADTDAPDENRSRAVAFVDAPSYAQALAEWHSAEDVNAWIGARFEYDAARAMRLSETQRQANMSAEGPLRGANCAPSGGREQRGHASVGGPCRLPIHAPAEFFSEPKGVCVDLSRFGVETLARIAPESHPRYLMIEFDPVTIRGNALRRHWVAAFERDGKLFFFADSKRPGHIAGPYESTQAFIDEYARYRGRAIVAFSERATYERTARLKRQ